MDIMNASGLQPSDDLGTYFITDLIQTGKRLGEATKLHIANVYATSLEGNRLKRPEISLVRDLEYLRVYDTNNGKITASYPDSAPWFHLCAPHCLLIKQHDGRTRRLMWTAIASRLPSDRNRSERVASTVVVENRPAEGNWLRCITDFVNPNNSISAGEQKARSVETIGDVSCLESIVLDSKVFLLAAHKTGSLMAYTEDLSTSNSLMADTMMGENIMLFTSINPHKAIKGIVSSVRNVHASLDGSRLLVLVSQLADFKNKSLVRVRVLQLSIQDAHPNRPAAAVLLSQDIALEQSMKGGCECSIHDGGQLHVWGGKVVQTFDLPNSSSQHYKTLQFKDSITSVLRLDQHSIAVCTTTKFERVNIQFLASQGIFDWPEPLSRSEITKQYDSKLIDHDKTSGRLLCLYGSRIITISTNSTTPMTIADFIDRGISQTNVTAKYQFAAYEAHLAENPRGDTKWEEWISHVLTLSKCIKENDTTKFDEIFGKLLGFITDSAVGEQYQSISLSPSQQLNNDEKLSIIISCIFEPVFDTKDYKRFGVKVKILPQKTFQWLVINGYATSSRTEHSFRRLGKTTTQSIRDAAVVLALAENDSSLSTLRYFITHSNVVEAAEASCAIGSAMMLKEETSSAVKQNGLQEDAMDHDHTSHDHLVRRDSIQSLSSGFSESQSALLQIALLRLIDKDHTTIIKALRSHLTNQQLFILIEYLRIEMSKQGWFVEVLHENAYTADKGKERHTITRLAKILGCVLDALGMAPWLNTATSVENENLIAWMKLEISAALEAVEEATYMSGILHEVSLFTKLLNSADKDRSQQPSRRIEPVTVDDGLIGSNALPTGLKPAGYIDVNVVKGGKVQKMSSRQIGHMKSKMVGAYSREKIDLNDFYQTPMQQSGKRKR